MFTGEELGGLVHFLERLHVLRCLLSIVGGLLLHFGECLHAEGSKT